MARERRGAQGRAGGSGARPWSAGARRQAGAGARKQADERSGRCAGVGGHAGCHRRAAGAQQARGKGARPGVLQGQQAVHSVHSAYFGPV